MWEECIDVSKRTSGPDVSQGVARHSQHRVDQAHESLLHIEDSLVLVMVMESPWCPILDMKLMAYPQQCPFGSL